MTEFLVLFSEQEGPKLRAGSTIFEQAEQIEEWMKGSQEVQDRWLISRVKGGLVQLPPEICLFHNLQSLCLHDNLLEDLPPGIGKLVNLTELILSNNQIKVLPPEIRGLTALTFFDISHNKLEEIPQEIEYLAACKRFMFIGNQLRSLPDCLMKLEREVAILVQDNPFPAGYLEAYQQRLEAHRRLHPKQGPSLLR